jgi:hypothetical protein
VSDPDPITSSPHATFAVRKGRHYTSEHGLVVEVTLYNEDGGNSTVVVLKSPAMAAALGNALLEAAENVAGHSPACDCAEHYPCQHDMIHDAVTDEPVRCRRCGITQEQREEEEQR